MYKFNSAFDPITVLIFLPTQAEMSGLCANQLRFSHGKEAPGLIQKLQIKQISVRFSKIFLFSPSFLCDFELVF